MNNLPSYCGLVEAKIRDSDKDLPIHTLEICWVKFIYFVAFSEYMNFKQNKEATSDKFGDDPVH